MATQILSRRAIARLAFGAALAIGVGGAALADATSDLRVKKIPADAALEASERGEITLIDIRTPKEWRVTGVPKGAVLADMSQRDFIARVRTAAAVNPNRPIALICARGERSRRAAAALTKMGFTKVFDVSEGVLGSLEGPGWRDRGLPLTAAP